ncbi:hypothetical protein Bca52824_030174 [Brassica carinata]|uniref:Uncharacterized protein n=1 Tax=Brassica carinata TaxID=52824 RepID=A0A8X7S5Q0_BRACI|nr:hypothetical protein Bca52824_030174 [Brassica carinata]
MARLVVMSKGEWSKSQNSVWRFEEDTTMMSHSILVRRTEEYDSLELKVRGLFNVGRQTPLVVSFQLPRWMLEPEGETSPPHTIRTKADIDMLLSVHEWNTEPRLCIVVGPQEVAKYHYICRSPFTIGRLSFLEEGVTEEQHLTRINNLMSHGRITCSEDVISEFNDPEKMMLMYRFSMEVDKARRSLDLNVDVNPTMGDHIVPTAENQPVITQPQPDANQVNANTGYTQGVEYAGISPVSVLRNSNAPMSYGGVRVGYVPYEEARYWEMRQGYYDSLMASSYALQLGRIYGVPGSEFTGYQSTDLNIVTSGDQEIPPYQLPVDVDSTASSTEFNTGVALTSQMNTSAIGTGYVHGHVISEKGETSRGVLAEYDIKGDVQETTDVKTQGAQRNEDDVVDGTPRAEQGGK